MRFLHENSKINFIFATENNQNFKIRLANVKLKEIDLWARENPTPNMVSLRTKTLKRVS